MSISVVISDQTSPLIERVRTAADAARLSLVGARAVAIGVREHLLKLQGERHRPGKGDSFYGRAARSVSSAQDGLAASVNIAQRGMRLRRLGGIVRPGPGKKLVAYPADDAPREAHERGPRNFFDLDLTKRVNPAHGGLQWCLIRRPSTAISLVRRKRKDGSVAIRAKAAQSYDGEIVFWLARKTTHRADTSVLPAAEHLQRISSEGIRTHLLNQAQRQALPPSS